jgi:hypothetical protein
MDGIESKHNYFTTPQYRKNKRSFSFGTNVSGNGLVVNRMESHPKFAECMFDQQQKVLVLAHFYPSRKRHPRGRQRIQKMR